MTHNDGDARVRLRPLAPDDQDDFIAQARASTGLHHPWYTMPGAAARVLRAAAAPARGQHLGFRQEDYSTAMLFIDGAWRDHERWAITREMTAFPPVDPHPTLPAR